MTTELNHAATRQAYIVTGPTSGIGRLTALELSRHGTVVLVGRDPGKLNEVRGLIEQRGGNAIAVVCDLSDIASVQHAASEIVNLRLPIAGLLNNAGIMQTRPTKNALGWDMTFATDHLGPFVLTEALIPHLPDGANVLFVASAVEDPNRGPARMAGFRGGRYISAEASARGEWMPDGSTKQGYDAYATSKQCTLATALEFSRENPRLHINAVEPGFNPTTGLGRRNANASARFVSNYIIPALVPLLMLFIKGMSTSKQAAQALTGILIDDSGRTGIYFDEKGQPMTGSALVSDPTFDACVVAETRALLSTIHA